MKKIIAGALAITVAGMTLNAVASDDSYEYNSKTDSEYSQGEYMHKRFKGMRGERDGQRMQKLYKLLDLSDDQQAQIDAIQEKYRPVDTSKGRPGQAIMEQMQALDPASPDYVSQVGYLIDQKNQIQNAHKLERAKMRHEIALFLTPEQRTKMKELRSEFKERRGKHREGRRGERRYR